jgi:hypothetical protein
MVTTVTFSEKRTRRSGLRLVCLGNGRRIEGGEVERDWSDWRESTLDFREKNEDEVEVREIVGGRHCLSGVIRAFTRALNVDQPRRRLQ